MTFYARQDPTDLPIGTAPSVPGQEIRYVGLRQLWSGGRRWWGMREPKTYFEVAETFGYLTEPAGPQLPSNVVTRNTRSDLASVPRILHGVVGAYGTHTLCALLHDVQCEAAKGAPLKAGQRRVRRHADRLFRRTLRDHAGFGIASRWMMWGAVRVFAFNRVRWFVLLALIAWLFAAAGVEQQVLGQPLPMLATILVAAGIVSVAVETTSPEEGVGAARTWSPVAALSMLGAVLVAAVAAVPVLAVVAVTGVIWVFRTALDLAFLGLHWLVVRPAIRLFVWLIGHLPQEKAEAMLEQMATPTESPVDVRQRLLDTAKEKPPALLLPFK